MDKIKQNVLIIPPNTRGSGAYEYICTVCYQRYPDYKAASEGDRYGCTGCGRKSTVEKMRACLLNKKRQRDQTYLF
jgi:rRNA maturation endonuclease Nob1